LVLLWKDEKGEDVTGETKIILIACRALHRPRRFSYFFFEKLIL